MLPHENPPPREYSTVHVYVCVCVCVCLISPVLSVYSIRTKECEGLTSGDNGGASPKSSMIRRSDPTRVITVELEEVSRGATRGTLGAWTCQSRPCIVCHAPDLHLQQRRHRESRVEDVAGIKIKKANAP